MSSFAGSAGWVSHLQAASAAAHRLGESCSDAGPVDAVGGDCDVKTSRRQQLAQMCSVMRGLAMLRKEVQLHSQPALDQEAAAAVADALECSACLFESITATGKPR